MARKGSTHTTSRLGEDKFKYVRYGRDKKFAYMDLMAMFKAKNSKELIKVATKIASKDESKAIIKRAFRKTRHKQSDKAIEEALNDLGEMLGLAGLNNTKQFLIEEMGFDKRTVDDGLIFDMDNKTVHVRGELRDTLDFEYYGVPMHVWPNVQRIKYWIKNRVIRRDPALRKIWDGMRGMDSRENRQGMLDDLAFLFSRAIFRDGLKKRPTTMVTNWEGDDIDSIGEQKPMDVDWKGRQVILKQIKKESYMGDKPSFHSKWRSRQ